ncbi:myo-inositol catabolism protein IolH [Dictyobacter alpinus]|uniref:Myo-inositol catabolism protein IolH n=1 Tax=Dictyobacter alpinus TaxID=2014873 RepID=A0A402BB19_9CHLR|nr:sugar phosphate isomerase/epimerase family protein [Dictyobacter alpinus]GCE28628.1 myo-inositol catabolism protein IolH [Dictyobacter alpinus]
MQASTPLGNIAVFPKCYMDELCVSKTMTLFDWIEQAATLDVDGLEFYPSFFASFERPYLQAVRAALQAHQLSMPMLCASPDFTKPTAVERDAEVESYKRMIELVDFFGASSPRTCRILSGQRRPGLSEEQGVELVVECIQRLLPVAQHYGVLLAIENHYKDNYWTYPEFAQQLPVFQRIIQAIDSPWFGVNYDPSNALLAGDDPLAVLDAVLTRVVSMHASDRRLREGSTLADLRSQEESIGYAAILNHGEIGTGLNDFSAIFHRLQSAGFHGWISIEDGINGLPELQRSVQYLRGTLAQM